METMDEMDNGNRGYELRNRIFDWTYKWGHWFIYVFFCIIVLEMILHLINPKGLYAFSRILQIMVTEFDEYVLPLPNLDRMLADGIAGSLGSILGVIWTGSLTLVGFYVEHMCNQKYGVRLLDILITDFGYIKIFTLGFTFIGELVIMLWAIMFDCTYVLIDLAFYQVVALIYILIIICRESSTKNARACIIKMVSEEIRGGKGNGARIARQNNILSHVLSSVNYTNLQGRKDLVSLYLDILEMFKENETVEKKEFSSNFVELIISAAGKIPEASDVIMALLIEGRDAYARRGILASVIQYMDDDLSVEKVIELYYEDSKYVLLWGMVYCMFCSQRNGMEFLEFHARRIRQILSHYERREEEFEDKVFEYWIEFYEEEMDKEQKKGNENHNCLNFRFDLLYRLLNN